jgi:NACalpha-BTF3-like transcription factor
LLVAGGTAAAVKMSKKDADRIEQSTGVPPEEMTEEELTQAMRDLGIQSIELTEEDQAHIQKESGDAAASEPQSRPPAASGPDDAYLDELEKLADLRDRGIITEEDFEAKKKKLLGI